MTLRAADLYAQPIIVGTTDELTQAFALDANVPVGVNYVPPNRQIIKDVTTGLEYVGDGITAYSDLTPLPGGGSGGLPIADAAGVTTGTADNPITGSGTYNWVQFPADTPAIAWGLEGDEFPRVIFGADPNDFCLVAIGDGTFDPVNSSATVYLGTVGGHPAMGISKLAVGVVRLVSGGTSGYDLAFDESTGVIVTDASDGHTYRLGTDNGAVTATQVT